MDSKMISNGKVMKKLRGVPAYIKGRVGDGESGKGRDDGDREAHVDSKLDGSFGG